MLIGMNFGVIQHHRRHIITLAFKGGFGPLQDLAVTAVLTFAIATLEGKTQLTMTYRVRGPDANLDKLAPIVDKVVGEGFGRLVEFAGKAG